ncbi:MAG: sigma 54-interacting transcriptional regulator, partial [Flavonifractor plautii]
TYIGNPENPLRDGDEHLLTLQGQRYLVRYRLITGSSGTTGTLIVTASASKPLQDRRQLRGSLVRQGLTSKYTFDDIIAVSQAMQGKIQIAKKFCTANSSVLITGETGTGKELFAHSIHAASRRAGQPFVAVNCAALPETLLESELFGYESGAFSGASQDGKPGLFELAHHGTIFLDEIGEISCPLQAKLLRVLQEREIRRIGSTAVIPVDVRVMPPPTSISSAASIEISATTYSIGSTFSSDPALAGAPETSSLALLPTPVVRRNGTRRSPAHI